jgi:hypothetical protein
VGRDGLNIASGACKNPVRVGAKFVCSAIADLGFRFRIAQLLKFAAVKVRKILWCGFCAPSHRFPMSRSARGGSASYMIGKGAQNSPSGVLSAFETAILHAQRLEANL